MSKAKKAEPEAVQPFVPAEPVPVVLVEAYDLLAPPDGRRFWTDETMDKPHHTVSEVAKVFFAKSPDWLRWRLDPQPKPGEAKDTLSHPNGWFLLDGVKVEPPRTRSGARYFRLYDLERMAHGLAQQGGIDGQTLVKIVRLIKTEAELYGYIRPEVPQTTDAP